MPHDFKEQRFLAPLIALVLASAVSACGGANSSATPPLSQGASLGTLSNVAPARAAVPEPSPTSTEFFAGITPNSNPKGITKGPGGLWFVEANAGNIGRISTSGTVTEFPSSGAIGNQIVEGSDHNLWFTDNADEIARITPHGSVTKFSVGNEAYGPWDITAGPDGNLWFTVRTPSFNAIGRSTTAGVITLFSNGLTPGDPAVHDITTGPDGNIWFTEEFANKIGRITTSGTITEFSGGISANPGLVDITSGPDGNLWFTENSANKIGRITPGGVVTEFSAGLTAGASPLSINVAEGALWFTEQGNGRVGRITVSGRITEFAIPTSLGVDLAGGPFPSDLWITDYSGSGIVRVTE